MHVHALMVKWPQINTRISRVSSFIKHVSADLLFLITGLD